MLDKSNRFGGRMAVLQSKKFWAVILGMLVLFVAQYVPGFTIDQERGGALLVIISSYVVAVSVDPGGAGLGNLFKSRKFWAALCGLVYIVLDGLGVKMPIREDMLVEFSAGIGALIASFAIEKKPVLPIPVSVPVAVPAPQEPVEKLKDEP
jgi:uncharacterized membrane protein